MCNHNHKVKIKDGIDIYRDQVIDECIEVIKKLPVIDFHEREMRFRIINKLKGLKNV